MIIERHSIVGYSGIGGKFSNFTALFDTLCEWDSRNESGDSVTYSYGGITIKLYMSSSVVGIVISVGTFVTQLSAGSGNQNDFYLNFIIAKSASSIGVNVRRAAKNIFPDSGIPDSTRLRFVLTKCLNLDTNAEEKGAVIQFSDSYGSYTLVTSTNGVVSTGSKNQFYINNATTILYPASCDIYFGYCPHVFIPVFQTSNYTNSKCTVDDKSYYILGGTMYVLDN